ncbi:fatty acid hydroxylase [Paenibacillus swuensis]|uniref:Fatty acid hydroxylase n=1 Tax=Paenibacillus swuensis TaxID=1178515 RepID=A0A172TF77_9BACL|nr:sterol desaturase family protein [Paenibacillus swuensis]ANE45709.1 fatty acid hydroxylase [Paenibacillus swuensis]
MKGTYIKEFLTFPDVTLMSLLFAGGLGYSLFHADSGSMWLALGIGMVAYIASEYTTHRFLFHMKPPKNPVLLRMIKRLHYDHHVEPNDLHLLFLPVWYSLPQMLVAAGVAYLITSSLLLTVAFTTGILGALLYYEWTHYAAHRPVQPLTPWGRWMKKVHQWHHFKNENYWYGVTNPAFDLLMGTFKEERDVAKSPTARNLEQREYPDAGM